MGFPTYTKDPNAILDYSFNWTNWLNDDIIDTSTFVADEGIVIDSDTKTTSAAIVWLSGGIEGEEYLVTNQIVTASGRQDRRSIEIFCRKR